MTSADPNTAPRRLGDFELIREIGRGGMGVVYEARQVSLNRRVALKVLSGGLGLSPKAVARFRREAEAAAKLHHTNIVPIYATGEEDDAHYYAMELITGPSLSEVINRLRVDGGAPASPSPDVHTGAETAAGEFNVAPASAVEPVSGDEEPSPPRSGSRASSAGHFDDAARMIAEVADALEYAHEQSVVHRDIKPSNLLLGPDGRLSVSDFGLARMLEQPGMTVTGEFVGTSHYMSPEQIAAGRAPLDHRTDVYSLGATLYELLTLQPPFPGERRDQVIAQIVSREPKPPRRINRRVPLDLETICLKALEKDPARRYGTAGEMAEDLRRYLNRYSINARRTGPVGRAKKWVRRRPVASAAIVLMVLMALAAAGVGLEARRAEARARAAEGQNALNQAQTEIFKGRFEEADAWLEQAEILDVDPGRIRLLRGFAALEAGDAAEARRHLELAAAQLPGSLGAYALLARADLQLGEWPDWEAVLEAMELHEPRHPEDLLYGSWFVSHYDVDQGLRWLEQLARSHPTPVVHARYGIIRMLAAVRSFDPADVEVMLSSLVTAKTQMSDLARPRMLLGEAHLVAAEVWSEQGRSERAAIHVDNAHAEAEALLESFPDAAPAHEVRATLAVYDQRWEAAVEAVEEARRRPDFFAPTGVLAPACLYRLGRLEEAIEAADLTGSETKIGILAAAEVEGVAAALERIEIYFEEGPPESYRFFPYERYCPYEFLCLLGDRDRAVEVSRERLEQAGPFVGGSAFFPVADRFVTGGADESALLGAAEHRMDRLTAHLLIGVTRLADGDRPGAIEHLTAAEQTLCWILSGGGANPYLSIAHPLVERLRSDPEWPPWMAER